MATKGDLAIVRAAALVQGIALVTFPAASTVFTDPDEYDLSTTAYGTMFVPQAIAAIAGSFLGARWASRTSTRRVYLCGLTANLASMALLVVSATVQDEHALAYAILLVATASLGLGFGFTVPALNTFTAAFYPTKVDGSVLVLNVCSASAPPSPRCSSRSSWVSDSGGDCRSALPPRWSSSSW
jgi:MFS family permease